MKSKWEEVRLIPENIPLLDSNLKSFSDLFSTRVLRTNKSLVIHKKAISLLDFLQREGSSHPCRRTSLGAGRYRRMRRAGCGAASLWWLEAPAAKDAGQRGPSTAWEWRHPRVNDDVKAGVTLRYASVGDARCARSPTALLSASRAHRPSSPTRGWTRRSVFTSSPSSRLSPAPLVAVVREPHVAGEELTLISKGFLCKPYLFKRLAAWKRGKSRIL